MSTLQPTLADQCYTRLKEGIITGELAPGEKLRLVKLKSYLNAGPTPIREALSRLTSSGLVVAEPNRGFFVKKVSEFEVRDVYKTFNEIELLALDQAMEHGDAGWEANILANLHRLSLIEKSTPPIDAQDWLQLNYAFHYALISACNSPCLLKVREDVYQLFDRYCHLSLMINESSLLLNNKEHCKLAKAVIERNREEARKLTTLHLENSLKQVLGRLTKSKIF